MPLIQSQKLKHVHEGSLPGGVQAMEEDSAEGLTGLLTLGCFVMDRKPKEHWNNDRGMC